MAKADMVRLIHPDSPESEPFVTTPKAYNAVWKAKGWQPVDEFQVDITVEIEEIVVQDGEGEAGSE